MDFEEGVSFMEQGGLRLRYQRCGEGDPLVLITGLGGDLLFWRSAMVRLSEHFSVIAFDNRGAGETTYPPGYFSVGDMADDVAALLVHLGINSAHVLGWSMGGNIAQEFALRHPEMVRTLTLASTYMRRPSRSSFAIGQIIEAGRALGSEAVMSMMNALCMSEEYYRKREGGINGNGRQVYDIEGMALQKGALDDYDINGRIGEIAAPTLIIHGEDDIMVPIRFGEEMMSSIPGSEMVRVPGAGHILRSEDYIGHLTEFIERHSE